MKKSVIILNHGLHISGVSRVLVNFANALVQHNYDVTIKLEINDFTLAEGLDERVRVSLFLKEPHPFGKRIKGFLRFYETWKNILLRLSARTQYHLAVTQKYDIEISFNRGAAAKIISGSTNKSAQHLIWVHNDYTKCDNPYAGFAERTEAIEGYKRFDHIICVSPQAQSAFSKLFGIYDKVSSLNNFVGEQKILDSKAEKNNKIITFISVGRLSNQKAFDVLLSACSILNKNHRIFNLKIIGDGELRESLEAQRKELGLDNVEFIGAVTNPYPYLWQSDAYVCSSSYEGLSTSVIEAMFARLPIVTTDCTGMRDILENGECGILCPINADALAAGMERLIDDENLRIKLSEASLKRAEFYNTENTFKRIQEILK